MRSVVAALLLLAAAACGDSEERAGTPEATRARTATGATAMAPPAAASASPIAPTPTPTPPRPPTPTPTPLPTPAPVATPPSTPGVSPAPALATTPATPATLATPVTPGPVGLTPVLDGHEFERPVELGEFGSIRDTGGNLFVAEQYGMVLVFHSGEVFEALDIHSQVSRRGNEKGLLSVALDPTFEASGHLWVYYSVAGGQRRTRLSRFTVDSPGANVVDVDSELVVLEVQQPFSNHNGGAIRFGPDGMLYLGFDDGGGRGDRLGNGQDLSTLLGAIIRIDVREASEEQPYRVPADNPLVAVPGARPEIWAYGFRNPWRMAFDPATGALWVADVGQNEVEEIDIVEPGGNYGWNRIEGDRCYPSGGDCDLAGTVPPVATYRHDEGCSVSGGFVYRGEGVPSLYGSYVYGDFCSGRIWALPADLRSGPVVIAESDRRIAGFGQRGGEIYVLAFDAPVMRIVELEP